MSVAKNIKKTPRPGAKKIPAFNGDVGDIDLNEFKNLTPKVYKNATFIKYGFIDLSKIDIDCPNFLNAGIRADTGRNTERVEEMKLSFRDKGFETTHFPPTIDTNGEIIGGRTRIEAAILNGEKWIPVAIYSRSDTSLLNTITNGLRENCHTPQTRAQYRDFVASGVSLVVSGQLARSEADIDAWLYNDVEIENFYDATSSGGAATISKIRNDIMRETLSGNSMLITRERDGWVKWIERKIGLKKDQYELVSMDNQSYLERAWTRKVLASKQNGQHIPVKVVFYTNETTASGARKKLEESIKTMRKHIDSTYDLFELMHGIAVSEKNRKNPYDVLGAVPQIINQHPTNGNTLVDISNY